MNSHPSNHEIINSGDVIEPGNVAGFETPGDMLRIKASAIISGAALFIGVGFLVWALLANNSELQTWATGLISLVVGAAIGFV